MKKEIKFFKLSLFLLLVLIGCEKDDCRVVEYYEESHDPMMKMCLIDGNAELYEVETYYQSGQIKSRFLMESGNINGKLKKFYESGSLKEESTYKEGILQGDYHTYRENGKPYVYNYFVDEFAVYAKTYKDQNGHQEVLETYRPVLVYEADTVYELGSTFRVKVSLPIPDTLVGDKGLYFAYQMKSISLKDSVIINPLNEVHLDSKEPITCSVLLDTLGKRVFYGHVINKPEKWFYDSFERVIEVVPPSSVNKEQ
jgi:hypothetical protein